MQAAASCNDGAAMSDEDWRVEVVVAESGGAKRLHDAAIAELYEHHDLRDRAVMTLDGEIVFAYAITREGAEAAEQVLRLLAEREQLHATFTLARWHPLAERWEPAELPLPASPQAIDAEQAEGAEADADFEHEEAESSQAVGIPEFEVRVTLPSHRDALAWAKRLAGESIPSQRHWRYLLIGAWSEDDANALAERLRSELGADADVRVERTAASLQHESGVALGPIVPF